jgi:hypothetical protein
MGYPTTTGSYLIFCLYMGNIPVKCSGSGNPGHPAILQMIEK